MKNILCPTDFSPLADNAIKFAIEIAKVCKSRLYICHVYHVTKVDFDPNFSQADQPLKKQVERSMQLTKLKYEKILSEANISVNFIIDEESTSSLFSRKVEQYDIDLIIMGSKGASGLEKVIFGSVAANAMKTANVPVLVIPPYFNFQPIKNIITAVDNKLIANDTLGSIYKFAHSFNAKLTFLNIDSKTDHEKSPIHFTNEFNVETLYRNMPISNSINESINLFIDKHQCNILCMIRRKKGFWESIFQKSITENQLYNSKIPLMILPEE